MGDDPRDSGCLCQLCGERYRVDIMLPDNLWERVRALSPAGANLICGPCITRRIERLGEFGAYDLTETP